MKKIFLFLIIIFSLQACHQQQELVEIATSQPIFKQTFSFESLNDVKNEACPKEPLLDQWSLDQLHCFGELCEGESCEVLLGDNQDESELVNLGDIVARDCWKLTSVEKGRLFFVKQSLEKMVTCDQE